MQHHDPESHLRPKSRKNSSKFNSLPEMSEDNKPQNVPPKDLEKPYPKEKVPPNNAWKELLDKIAGIFCSLGYIYIWVRDHPIHGREAKIIGFAAFIAIAIPAMLLTALFGKFYMPQPMSNAIVHYMAIDNSDSARNDPDFQETAQKFCKVAASDRPNAQSTYFIEFASIQSQQNLFDNCSTLFPIKPIHTKIPYGTDLISLLDYLLNITGTIKNDKKIVMTILIQHEEPGKDLFNSSNESSYNHLVEVLHQFSSKGIPVLIISTEKEVLEKLRLQEVESIEKIRICDQHQLVQCTEDTFSSVTKNYKQL